MWFRAYSGRWEVPALSQPSIYKNPEGFCRDHGEGGVRDCGHPCPCAVGRFLELRGNMAPRCRANKRHTVTMGKQTVAQTVNLNKGSSFCDRRGSDGRKRPSPRSWSGPPTHPVRWAVDGPCQRHGCQDDGSSIVLPVPFCSETEPSVAIIQATVLGLANARADNTIRAWAEVLGGPVPKGIKGCDGRTGFHKIVDRVKCSSWSWVT